MKFLTLAFVARCIIFFHVGIPMLFLTSVIWLLTPSADREDWVDLLEWVWKVEYARD